MKRAVVTFLGSFLYTGFFPFAPATCASLLWLLAYLYLPGGAALAHPTVVAAAFPIAIYLSWEMERYYGHDASVIVIDEFVGMQVTFVAIEPHLVTGCTGFILFRLFDVVKPFPAGASQRLKGGFGVVTDDVIAGIYARIVLMVLVRFLHAA